MKCIGLLYLVLLLPSCESRQLRNANNERVNRSSLYDPPTVTLIPGENYRFQEGVLTGDNQRFHSEYSYLRALIIGSK